jgi:hypothetical protein
MKKEFDAVEWMRRRRTQIDEEDKGLTWAKKRQKTREEILRDPVLARLSTEIAAPGTAAPKAPKQRIMPGEHNRKRPRRS